MRLATAEDFKVGITLVSIIGRYEYTIMRKYDDGIWEARTSNGECCVFECEADCYEVKL